MPSLSVAEAEREIEFPVVNGDPEVGDLIDIVGRILGGRLTEIVAGEEREIAPELSVAFAVREYCPVSEEDLDQVNV